MSKETAVNRRDFLRLAGLVASGATLAACSSLYTPLAEIAGHPLPGPIIDPVDFRLLRRLTYGPGPAERGQVAEYGLSDWIEEQLDPGLKDDPGLALRLRNFDHLDLDADALSAWDREMLTSGFKQATLLRKIYSQRQLFEMMVEFWTDHFNIALAKGDCWFLKVVDDRDVIRPHALGNFHDLLWASARSPAMLVYLDNQANHRDAPNENYARELLELHTLGVNGGYEQDDVMELARCFTGWTVKEHFWRGEFSFDANSHDNGNKSVLGQTVGPAGINEAEQVLAYLSSHPATAFHIAAKLVNRFITDTPLMSHLPLVNRAAGTFLKTRGDIPAVLRVILLDGLLKEKPSPATKYRRPLDYLAGALRAVSARSNGGPPLQNYLARMGQPLYEWPTPDGPPDDSQSWMGNLMPRWQFAAALARNEIEGTRYGIQDLLPEAGIAAPGTLIDSFSLQLFGNVLESSARQQLIASLEGAEGAEQTDLAEIILAGLLASPAYQWR